MTGLPVFLIFPSTVSYETFSVVTSTVCFSRETSYLMPFVKFTRVSGERSKVKNCICASKLCRWRDEYTYLRWLWALSQQHQNSRSSASWRRTCKCVQASLLKLSYEFVTVVKFKGLKRCNGQVAWWDEFLERWEFAFVDGCILELRDVEGKFIVANSLAWHRMANRWRTIAGLRWGNETDTFPLWVKVKRYSKYFKTNVWVVAQ